MNCGCPLPERIESALKPLGSCRAFVVIGLVAACSSTTASGRALIIDQLSLTYPNPAFVEEATDTLESAGFAVEYVAGRDVTVDFFRSLPAHGAEIVILRVHSAGIELPGGEPSDDVAVFTGEMIDVDRYRLAGIPAPAMTAVAEMRNDASHPTSAVSILTSTDVQHVSPVFYDPEEQELPHFGVRPSFFEEVVDGSFPESAIFLMGCDSLRSTATASAFASHNAKHIAGWLELT